MANKSLLLLVWKISLAIFDILTASGYLYVGVFWNMHLDEVWEDSFWTIHWELQVVYFLACSVNFFDHDMNPLKLHRSSKEVAI